MKRPELEPGNSVPGGSFAQAVVNCPGSHPIVLRGGHEFPDSIGNLADVMQSRPLLGENGWFVRIRSGAQKRVQHHCLRRLRLPATTTGDRKAALTAAVGMDLSGQLSNPSGLLQVVLRLTL